MEQTDRRERSTKDHRDRTGVMLHPYSIVHKEQLFMEIRYPTSFVDLFA